MGETIPVTSPTVGGQALNRWLEVPSQRAPPSQIPDFLFLTQDMMAFQRQIRDREAAASLTVGELVEFNITVPEGEAWRIIWIRWTNDDSTTHTIDTFVSHPGIVGNAYGVNTQLASADNARVLWPRNPEAAPSLGLQQILGKFEIYPGDVLRINDRTVMTNASGIMRVALRYEIVPPPRNHQISAQAFVVEVT